MTLSEHAQEIGQRLLREYLEAERAASSGLPRAEELVPGRPITPFPITRELLAEWTRLDAVAEAAKTRWRAWIGDPESYSHSLSDQ